MRVCSYSLLLYHYSIWNSVQQNHPCDTFFRTSKRKVKLALKCMANYKFSAYNFMMDSPILDASGPFDRGS